MKFLGHFGLLVIIFLQWNDTSSQDVDWADSLSDIQDMTEDVDPESKEREDESEEPEDETSDRETAKESDTDSISNMAYHVREDNDFEPQNDESEESLEENDGKARQITLPKFLIKRSGRRIRKVFHNPLPRRRSYVRRRRWGGW